MGELGGMWVLMDDARVDTNVVSHQEGAEEKTTAEKIQERTNGILTEYKHCITICKGDDFENSKPTFRVSNAVLQNSLLPALRLNTSSQFLNVFIAVHCILL